MSGAPSKVVRTLAFDDAVEVAAPVLTHSDQLDDQALVENARTKSQGHLLAISSREVLTKIVTDILVDRGNPLVVTGTRRIPVPHSLTLDFRLSFESHMMTRASRCASGRDRTFPARNL
jgi:Uncharacterised protein conserved in bacteria (DUF2336)